MELKEQLEGVTWYSPIGSSMEFKMDGTTGIMSGVYHTAPGKMIAPLIGRFNPDGPGAFGWTVSWPKSLKYPTTSETSWGAYIENINGIPTIVSKWIITEQLEGNLYYSTVNGCERYTPNKPDEKTIEANKHERTPHPLD